jgi:AmiR/NasT family two-component response regulator
MSSYALDGERRKMEQLGSSGYIEKPIDPHTVMQELELYRQRSPANKYLKRGKSHE